MNFASLQDWTPKTTPYPRAAIFQKAVILLKCPSPKIFYFLIWNYTLLKKLLRKNYAIWAKDDFLRIF